MDGEGGGVCTLDRPCITRAANTVEGTNSLGKTLSSHDTGRD